MKQKELKMDEEEVEVVAVAAAVVETSFAIEVVRRRFVVRGVVVDTPWHSSRMNRQ